MAQDYSLSDHSSEGMFSLSWLYYIVSMRSTSRTHDFCLANMTLTLFLVLTDVLVAEEVASDLAHASPYLNIDYAAPAK
jgi:hypothetical protein